MTSSIFSVNSLFTKRAPSFIKTLFAFLLVLATLNGCSKNEKNEVAAVHMQNAHLLAVTPETSYTVERNYLGQVKSKQNTELAFEYAGTVNHVYVDMGDTVKKGQTLAKQNTKILTFKVKELEAHVSQTNAQIKLNQANLSRIKALTDDGYSSKQRLDELNAENEVLTANVLGVKAQIQAINYQINKATLTAPFQGVITRKMVSKGEQTSPVKAIFHLIEQSNNEITFGIPSSLANTLKKNQILKVEINDSIHKGKILSISKQIDPLNRTVQLRLKLIKKVNSYNGQLVKVHIEKKVNQSGFWVPLTAVTDGVRGQWQVFLAIKESRTTLENKDNVQVFKIQSATIQVLNANKTSVYISGLPQGKHLIVSEGLHRFVTGQLVTSLNKTGITL